jgi:hypothetical protein
MANGAVLDPTTPLGQVRLVVGDEVPNATSGDYLFADNAIAVALLLSSGSVLRSVAMLVKQLALAQTMAGQSIKASDFAINTSNRGKDLLQVAMSYEKQADEEDARLAAKADGSFIIVKTKLTQDPMDTFFPKRLWDYLPVHVPGPDPYSDPVPLNWQPDPVYFPGEQLALGALRRASSQLLVELDRLVTIA